MRQSLALVLFGASFVAFAITFDMAATASQTVPDVSEAGLEALAAWVLVFTIPPTIGAALFLAGVRLVRSTSGKSGGLA